jgi:ribosomal protein S27AE
MKKERWTEKDELFVINNYLSNGSKFISERLNRTIPSIKSKAKHLGIITYSPKKWTEEELIFLKQNYETKGCKFICEKLNRNRGSVQKKASDFNLQVTYSPTFSQEELERAVKDSYCFSDLVDRLRKTKSGAYFKIIKKYIALFKIDTSHFNPYKKNAENLLKSIKKFPLEHWLKYGSGISSNSLKLKLYKAELKKHECEKCGQGEIWNGEKLSLILDHKNGDPKDNRLENLRILCPNCNATLPTHCRGYKNK